MHFMLSLSWHVCKNEKRKNRTKCSVWCQQGKFVLVRNRTCMETKTDEMQRMCQVYFLAMKGQRKMTASNKVFSFFAQEDNVT